LIALESLLIDVPILTESTQIGDVIVFLDQHDYSHLAIVDQNNVWIGTIATDFLYEIDETEKIEKLLYHVESFFVYETDDLAKITDTFILNKSNLLPVLNQNGELKGMLSKTILTGYLAQSTFLTERGLTLIIEKEAVSCSFATIAQIVESNNAKFLGVLILTTTENKIQLLLRISQINTEAIINDLRRFDFTIVSQHAADQHQNKVIEHSNYLNKFLNI